MSSRNTTLFGKPIHLSIIAYIKKIGTPNEMPNGADLIIGTALLENHDKIATTWRKALEYFNLDDSQFGVLPALKAKKAAVEKKARQERLSQNVDRLLLRVPVVQWLKHNGIVKILELCERTKKQLKALDGSNETRLSEIEYVLQLDGLSLGMKFSAKLRKKILSPETHDPTRITY